MIALPATDDGERANAHAGLGVGSGRSIPGFPLNEALQSCTDLLEGHGGHPMAAGLRIRPEHLGAFRERFCAFTARHYPSGPPAPVLTLDAETPLSTLTLGLLRDLDKLEPYGAGNPRPLFLPGNLQIPAKPRKAGTGPR